LIDRNGEKKMIECFKCSTAGTFEFKSNNTYYNCEFAGGKNVKVEYNTVNGPVAKSIECTPVDYDNYYDFCYSIAEQIVKQMEE